MGMLDGLLGNAPGGMPGGGSAPGEQDDPVAQALAMLQARRSG